MTSGGPRPLPLAAAKPSLDEAASGPLAPSPLAGRPPGTLATPSLSGCVLPDAGPGVRALPGGPAPGPPPPGLPGSRPSRPPAVKALLLPGPCTPQRRPACRRISFFFRALHALAAPRRPGAAPCGPQAALEAFDGGIEQAGQRSGLQGLGACGAGRRAVSPSGAVPPFLRRKDWQLCPSATGGARYFAPHGQTAPPATLKMGITPNLTRRRCTGSLFIQPAECNRPAPLQSSRSM